MIKPVEQKILLCGAVLMMLAIMIGAFGAHALETLLVNNNRQDVFDTASHYHFYHALAMLFMGLLFMMKPSFPKKGVISVLMLAGIVLFSGSLYLLSILNLSWLGAITPIGGVLLLISWALFAFYLTKVS